MAFVPTLRRAYLMALVIVVMLITATPARADYASGGALGCSGYNAGGRDAAGYFYMPCNGSIRVYRPDGTLQSTATTDANILAIAPSPDGAHVYSISGSGAIRLNRGADGNYRRDPGFTFRAPAHYAQYGWRVCGWGIATDAYGKVYISNGGWCAENPNEILKYAPDGTLITRFGDYGKASHWDCVNYNPCRLLRNDKGSVPGHFQPNMSISVTADGSRVWVADQNNQRIQVFRRAADTVRYEFHTMWSGEGTRYDGQAGAVYGVAVDAWGHGYVALTTARVIYRLDPNGGNPVLVADRSGAGWPDTRPHTLAVDARGNVLVGEWNHRITRTAPLPGPVPALPPEPKPDTQDPVLHSVAAPAETTASTVSVTVRATDDTGVSHMRIADELGVWGAWRPFAATFTHGLSEGLGTKTVYVQVRDGVGRESTARSASIVRRGVPDTADPVLSMQVPSTSTTSNVNVTISASDDIGVTHIRFATEAGTPTEWQAWTSGTRTVDHVLPQGYGPRAVSVQVRDAAFRTSAWAQATVVVAPATAALQLPAVEPEAPAAAEPDRADRTAPRITKLLVPVRSCTQRILVRMATQDDRGATQVRFANESGRFGAWRAYSGRMVHVLSRGTTRKVVYVQVRDAAGNTSSIVVRKLLVRRCS